MSEITRRKFMKSSIAVGTAAVMMPYSRVLGANDEIRVAVAGINSRGGSHIGAFNRLPGVRVVALCDPDQKVLARHVKKFTDRNEKVDAYTDIRKLLEDKNIDALSIGTPNHWHSLMTIWACQAGKDVFVEKPVSHNIYEGRKMVEAARKYKRIVQTGTQKRSDQALHDVFEYLQKGNMGKIKVARGFCYKPRGSIGKVSGPQTAPSHIDYDLWTGPAAMEPLMRKKLHYDWHWVWNTGNGDLGNQGIHEMDLCRWAIGQNKLPDRVMSIGGRFGYIDDGQTANTQIAILDYKPVPIIFEVRGLPRKKGDSAMDRYRNTRIGVVIQCEHGYFSGGGGGGWVYDNDGKKIKQFTGDGGAGHYANFIKALRSRKVSDLNADIIEGHLSSSLCHLANVSHRVGKQVNRDQIMETIKADKEAIDSFDRFQEHLLVNGVDINETPRMLGPWLEIDADKERFVGKGDKTELAAQANKLLTRQYRESFVVPENV